MDCHSFLFTNIPLRLLTIYRLRHLFFDIAPTYSRPFLLPRYQFPWLLSLSTFFLFIFLVILSIISHLFSFFSSSLIFYISFFFHLMARNTITDNRMSMFCLDDGEATPNAFSVEEPE